MDSENELYHSKLVTCVDDSDEDIDYRVSHMDHDEELAYDLKVPNESWSNTEFKSTNLNYRPRPLGCSSDSPDSCTSSGLDNKEHYDSLEEIEPDPEPVNVMVRHPFPAEIVVVPPQQVQGGSGARGAPPGQPEQQNSRKRSLPPIPKDHSLQQQRAYEILRQQWQCTPSSTTGNGSDSLDDDEGFFREINVHDQSSRSRPHVEGRSADFSDYDLLDDQNFNVNLTSKRQLPKPPPVSPIILLNEDPAGGADGEHAHGQGGHHAHHDGQLHPMTYRPAHSLGKNPEVHQIHQELEHLQADSGCASLNNTEHDHSLVEELLPVLGGDDEKTCEIDGISRRSTSRKSSSNNNNEKRNQQQVQQVEKKVEKENLELLLQTSTRRHRNNNHLEHPSTSSGSQWAKNPEKKVQFN